MKKFSLLLISVLLLLTLVGCGDKCDHTYDNACDATCNECGETREVGAHDYAEATCTSPKTCKVCGTTEGEALGHAWTTPDVDLCEVQSTCSRCGATDGENVEHTWVAASCESPRTCPICGHSDGDALGHTPEADDGNCTTPVKCENCDQDAVAGRTEHIDSNHDGICDNGGCQITVGSTPEDTSDGIDLPDDIN